MMLQLKTGIITAQPISGPESLSGLLSEHFGAHQRYPECGPNHGWVVYHLGSGLTLGIPSSLWLARALIITMESSGLDWDFCIAKKPQGTIDIARFAYMPFRKRQAAEADRNEPQEV